MGRARFAWAALAFAAALASTPAPAAAGPHPLFNDQGTLTWYMSFAEAQSVARDTGRLIFIDSGRRECGTCRQLISGILPAEPVRSRISRIAIGFADDCDRSDPTVSAILAANVPNATMLPIVGFVTPELRWVTGWSGGTSSSAVMQHLAVAEDRYQRCQQVLAARRAALAGREAPPPSVAPAPVREVARTAPPAPVRSSSAPTAAPAAPREVARSAPRPGATPLVGATPTRQDPPRVTPPAPAPLAAASSPAAAKSPEVLLGSPDARMTDVGPAPTPQASGSVSTDSLLDRVRAAAAEQSWGQVLRLGDDAADLPATRDSREIDTLVRRAQDWVLDSLSAACDAAAARRYDDALRTLAVLRREIDGTGCPAAVDAARGERAVERLRTIELGSPDRVDTPDAERRVAYAEFRGTRWAPLFRHGS